MVASTDTGEIRTYEVVTSGGVFRVDVPASARVSYGPVIGAAGKAAYGGNCLRIWQGTKATEVQRALFHDVLSFRDLSIPMKVRAVRKYGNPETEWWQDNGGWTGKRADLVEKAWKDADEIVEMPSEEMPEKPDFNVYDGSRSLIAKREF